MQMHTPKRKRLFRTLAMNHSAPVTHFKMHQEREWIALFKVTQIIFANVCWLLTTYQQALSWTLGRTVKAIKIFRTLNFWWLSSPIVMNIELVMNINSIYTFQHYKTFLKFGVSENSVLVFFYLPVPFTCCSPHVKCHFSVLHLETSADSFRPGS